MLGGVTHSGAVCEQGHHLARRSLEGFPEVTARTAYEIANAFDVINGSYSGKSTSVRFL